MAYWSRKLIRNSWIVFSRVNFAGDKGPRTKRASFWACASNMMKKMGKDSIQKVGIVDMLKEHSLKLGRYRQFSYHTSTGMWGRWSVKDDSKVFQSLVGSLL